MVVSNAFGTSLSSTAVLTDLSSLVAGWGDNTYGETNEPPSLTNVVAIAGGSDFSLALQGNGTVAAWGYNGDGETNVPAGLSNVVAIACGSYHCLALEGNGTVTTWGNNTYGQSTVPSGLSKVVGIAGGQCFSLALQSNGTVAAWGDNIYGQTRVPQVGQLSWRLPRVCITAWRCKTTERWWLGVTTLMARPMCLEV